MGKLAFFVIWNLEEIDFEIQLCSYLISSAFYAVCIYISTKCVHINTKCLKIVVRDMWVKYSQGKPNFYFLLYCGSVDREANTACEEIYSHLEGLWRQSQKEM